MTSAESQRRTLEVATFVSNALSAPDSLALMKFRAAHCTLTHDEVEAMLGLKPVKNVRDSVHTQ